MYILINAKVMDKGISFKVWSTILLLLGPILIIAGLVVTLALRYNFMGLVVGGILLFVFGLLSLRQYKKKQEY